MVIKKVVANDKTKLLGMATLLVAFLIGFAPTLGITSLTISDSNPNTYIAVVMLMLPLFLIFSLKENINFRFDRKGVISGIAVFAVYVGLLSYMRVALSYLFLLYRIDALLSAVLLAALTLVVFGIDGLNKLKFAIIYALFASPLILTPIVALNGGFTAGSAAGVYGLLRLAGLNVASSGILYGSASSVPITIASTCTDLGLFIALVMLLVPIAYLMEGSILRKSIWIASATALMLVLNIIRMFYISYTWITTGPSAGLSTFHEFAGQLLFYAALVIAVLAADRYGLKLYRVKKTTKRNRKVWHFDNALLIPILVSLAMAVIGLVLALPYGQALNLAPLSALNHSSVGASAEASQIGSSLEYAKMNITVLGQLQLNLPDGAQSYLFSLHNSTYNGNGSIFVVVTPSNAPISTFTLPIGGTVLKTGTLLLNNGISLHEAVVYNGTYLNLAYFSVPYVISSTAAGNAPQNAYANYQFIAPAYNSSGAGGPFCTLNIIATNYFESGVYNFFSGGSQPQELDGALYPAYNVANQLA